MAGNEPDRLRSEKLEATLSDIAASGVLGTGRRRMALLRYLIEQELAGRGEQIKAYSIAVDVLGRGEDFDPSTDSIVRTEIGRLRDALHLFYADRQGSGHVQIEIPKGTYRPRLQVSEPTPVHPAARYRPPRRVLLAGAALLLLAAGGLRLATLIADTGAPASRPGGEFIRIAVSPIRATGTQPDVSRLAFGLRAELVTDLSAFPWIVVVSGTSADAVDADYDLRVQLQWTGARLQASSVLTERPAQAVIWTNRQDIDAALGPIEAVQHEVATTLVERLATRHGIAPDLARSTAARRSNADLDAFMCFMGIYAYWDVPSDERHAALRDCLQSAVARFPEYGEAWAALGFLYMDEARQGRNPRPGRDAWQDAGAAISNGLVYAPLRQPTLNAAMVFNMERPDRDLDAFRRYGDRLVELFPRHTLSLATYGSKLAEFGGQWDEGLELVDLALQLDPQPPSWYFLPGALDAVAFRDTDAALQAVVPLSSQTSKPELVVKLLAAARTGDRAAMDVARALLREQGLDGAEDVANYLRNRRYHPDLEAALLDYVSILSRD
ncbi:hypothetical protein AADZ90_009155 [Aestuariibius sp. 2305UL40-4]|uniref:hypothetical protein n=1 Tax=Aestuariibius violaceus TaxID=3234132 RepID=UPI00345E0909